MWYIVIGVIALALLCGWRPFQTKVPDGTVNKPPGQQLGAHDL